LLRPVYHGENGLRTHSHFSFHSGSRLQVVAVKARDYPMIPAHGTQLDALAPGMVLHFNKCNGGRRVESAITVKGQATIPKAIREHLGLKPGDRVKFFVHPDGSVVLLPKLSASILRGMVKLRRRRPVTIEEMTKAAAEGAAGGMPHAKRR
jgi:antitoxin PrlF